MLLSKLFTCIIKTRFTEFDFLLSTRPECGVSLHPLYGSSPVPDLLIHCNIAFASFTARCDPCFASFENVEYLSSSSLISFSLVLSLSLLPVFRPHMRKKIDTPFSPQHHNTYTRLNLIRFQLLVSALSSRPDSFPSFVCLYVYVKLLNQKSQRHYHRYHPLYPHQRHQYHHHRLHFYYHYHLHHHHHYLHFHCLPPKFVHHSP